MPPLEFWLILGAFGGWIAADVLLSIAWETRPLKSYTAQISSERIQNPTAPSGKARPLQNWII